MAKRAVWAVAAVGLVCGVGLGAERRLLEAEEFGRLARVPFFREDAKGWYALEANCRAYGAPGKGACAMIHAGAADRTIRTTLSRALPAGTYKVFISSKGLYWHDGPNVLKVRVGAAESRIAWEKPAGRFTWIEGTPVKLTRPATRVELEAVSFGGKGFGLLYDTSSRAIPVDQVYVTSDLGETTGPSVAGAHLVRAGRDVPGERISRPGRYRRVDHLAAPRPLAEPVACEIVLKAFDGRRNLIPNSSFELGGGDGWSSANNSRTGQVHVFGEADHVKGPAVHGDYAMRFPGKGSQKGLQFGRVWRLPAGGTYTLSASMRAVEATGRAALGVTVVGEGKRLAKAAALSVGGALTGEYKRFAATGELAAGRVVLTVRGACLVDAVQLEPGRAASDYAPRADVEASLTTDCLAHILYSDAPVRLTAWAHNAGAKDTEAALRYRAVDVRERTIAERTVAVPVAAGRTVRRTVTLKDAPRGIFNVLYAAAGRPYADGELIFSVLPPLPEAAPRHALGSNMDSDPASFELMRRMGHTWQLYCKLYADRPDKLTPAPGQFHWAEARKVLTMPRPFGMRTMPALWPTRLPEHLKDKALSAWSAYGDGRRDVARQIKRGKPIPIPDLKAWRGYCEQLARHLGDDAPWWTIEDETENYYSPREFGEIVRATAAGFADSGKAMKVSLSCTPDFTEEMIAELGGAVPLAGFGASSYNFEYWDARKVRYLQRRYGVPWFCIGVGVGRCPPFRRTAPFGEAVYSRAVRTAQEMVLLAIVQDAKVIGHYTGRLWFRGALQHTDYPLMDYDGTPLVHGYVYSAVPLMLADAVPVEDVHLPGLRTMAFVFRQGGRLGAVTWANNHPGLDIHWKSDPLIWRDLRVPAAAGKVTVADMFGNPRRDVRADGGDLVFDLGEEPTFLRNRAMPDKAFVAAVGGMTARPRPIEMRLAFLPDGTGGVDLGVLAANHTGRALSGLALDANFPPNRMVTRTGWTLPDRHGTIADIPAGGQAWGRIPTRIGGTVPVENATYTAWITEPGGAEHRMADTCWLAVARPLHAVVNGRLNEWDLTAPAWMHYTYSWARFGRHITQFERGGEHFQYVRRIDARAAICAGWDDRYLYVAVRCEDDDAVFAGERRDALEIHLSLKAGSAKATRVVRLTPTGTRVEIGGAADGVRAAMTRREVAGPRGERTIWTIEAAVALAWLGGAKRTGDALGFDVVWHDADHDGETIVTGTWRWAGRSTGLGTLLIGR